MLLSNVHAGAAVRSFAASAAVSRAVVVSVLLCKVRLVMLTLPQVVLLNKRTFSTAVLGIHLRVEKGEEGLAEVSLWPPALSDIVIQVNLKINNLNIEDVFDQQRLVRLEQLFRANLWPESQQVCTTSRRRTSCKTLLQLGTSNFQPFKSRFRSLSQHVCVLAPVG